MQDFQPKLFRAVELAREYESQEQHYRPVLDWVRLHVEPDPDDLSKDVLILRDRVDERLLRDWALLVGDAMHNARSALDHTVHELIGTNGEQPTRDSAFPTARGTEQKVNAEKLKGTSAAVRAAVKALEPWQGGKGHWLWVVTALDNIDKHRVRLAFFNEWGQDIRVSDPLTGATRTESIMITDQRNGDVLRKGSRGSIALSQGSGAMFLSSTESDHWDGNGPEGYPQPVSIVLQECIMACKRAIDAMRAAA